MARAERTRASLVRAALDLFYEHGYDLTTAAAIAQRAGVTEMTFFRHFPSKDSVLIDDPYDPLIADAIVQQPAGLSPVVAAILGVAEAWASVPPTVSAQVRERLRIVARTPSLRGAIARNSAATEGAIAEALTARGVTTTEARIAAAATVGALSAALLQWADGTDTDLVAAIDLARRVLQGDPR